MFSTQVSIPGYQVSEQLYNGSRTLVYRGYRETDSLPVVIKLLKNPYPSFSELLSFRNQYTIAKNLHSPLIIQTYSLEPYQNSYGLVMEDFGGISLKDYLTSDNMEYLGSGQEFLLIAIALCKALDILYHERIVHKDIKPSNILINPQTKQIKLIDFSIASLLPREMQTLVNPNVLEGTLAYLSPEQTGRMNRGIDYRTDFYSLGVTFYELLTCSLPFKSHDPMELVHCHLAKLPDQSKIQNSKFKNGQPIPQVLGEIVMKLMAKNAEGRYQSALGLKFDLEKCLTQLQETGQIDNFKIAQRDVCDRFIIPDKLYGRETEVSTLLQAFERVSLGATEMMLVAGFSGIGKTAVVNEVHKPIVRQRGYFIKGKYDQFQRNIPFSAFVQAFRDLIGQLLTLSDTQIQQWKNNILDAVGSNGQVIIEVIPELERIIGEQPPAPELSGTAAQNRFYLLFQKFTQVFTSESHPLVMFLDDLQWADSASLKLMQLLMADTNRLLLIGAYRDNEVNPVHPLMLTLNEIEKALFTIHTITLTPLSQGQVNQLVAETLKSTENLALPLSQLVFQKTQGNPFFATQFLKALHQDGLIQFDFESGCWQCDIAQVSQQAVTDDVVAFMAVQLRKMPQSTQEMLQLAACLGNQFDLATLAIVAESSSIETATCLWKALQEGLILPTSDVYKFYQEPGVRSQESGGGSAVGGFPDLRRLPFRSQKSGVRRRQRRGRVPRLEATAVQESEESVIVSDSRRMVPGSCSYKFLHDRVQQAAYSLIPAHQKTATHLKIGQLLSKNLSEIEQDEKVFDLVGHLNLAIELITQPRERETLAQLNLKAGGKARNSTAYGAAKVYLQTGISLLQTNCWQNLYELTLDLYVMATEVAYLNGDFDHMELLAALVLQEAQTIFDKVKIYEIQIAAQTAQSQLLESIATGRDALLQLGVELPTFPDEVKISESLQDLTSQLQGRQIQELVDLPVMSDPTSLAAMQLLGKLFSPILIGMPSLLPLLSSTMVRLSLHFGNAPASMVGYVLHGMVLCAFLGEVETSYGFGKLALSLLDKFNRQEHKSIILNLFGAFIQHHQETLTAARLTLKDGYRAGMETGDFLHAGYNIGAESQIRFFAGVELDSCESDLAAYSTALAQIKQYSAQVYLDMMWQTVKNLRETGISSDCLIGTTYDETVMIPKHHQDNEFTAIAEVYIHKLLLAYSWGNYTAAYDHIAQVKPYLMAVSGLIYVPIFHFYAALTHLALFPTQPQQEQAEILAVAQTHQTTLHQWAHSSPMNHLHKWYLVEAERHRVLGEKIAAIECYDKAITLAQDHQFLNEEALANELAAKFYLDWGKKQFAQIHLTNAYYCYARWGALALTNHLEKLYPQLLQPILQQQRLHLNTEETLAFHRTSSSSSISDVLDLTSVLKAAQAISTSLELDLLIASLTRIILENSGAKKSVLLLPDQDTWQVRAITLIDQQSHEPTDIKTILITQFLDTCQDIPVRIIHYVKNTQQTIVIDNCKTDIPGVIGEYMLQHQPQSVLCTPIINQANLVGILYLENDLTSGVFTRDRLSVINLLCTQAAISLENAQLYTNLQYSEARFQRLAENAPGMIYQFQLSPDGTSKLNYASTGCDEIYGISSEQAVADASSLISVTHPEDIAHYLESITISAQTLEPWRYSGRIITPHGQEKWIQAASRPIKQADGTIIWDGLVLDVTERKQAEAAVIQKSQELEKTLQDLQQAQLQVIQSEKMSALGNLVAGVAHEMNNPLGFIAASLKQAKPTLADIFEHLKLYQESLSNPSDEIKEHAVEIDLDYSLEDLPKMINSMTIACDRLKNISTSLRTFSRADKDYKVPFNIHSGIDSTILILKHRLKANEQRPAIEVITEYGDFPEIDCFPGQLNQVFMNILANAIDALEESNIGRTFAEIQALPNRIFIQTLIENSRVKITIADNGLGMTEQVKEKVFDHLFTTKAVGKGTGLGLAIARQIVESTHGGKLSFHSTQGVGTEFFIEIPV